MRLVFPASNLRHQREYGPDQTNHAYPRLDSRRKAPAQDLVDAILKRRGGTLINPDKARLWSEPQAHGWNVYLTAVRTDLPTHSKLHEFGTKVQQKNGETRSHGNPALDGRGKAVDEPAFHESLRCAQNGPLALRRERLPGSRCSSSPTRTDQGITTLNSSAALAK